VFFLNDLGVAGAGFDARVRYQAALNHQNMAIAHLLPNPLGNFLVHFVSALIQKFFEVEGDESWGNVSIGAVPARTSPVEPFLIQT
jgi:hypothetical protein